MALLTEQSSCDCVLPQLNDCEVLQTMEIEKVVPLGAGFNGGCLARVHVGTQLRGRRYHAYGGGWWQTGNPDSQVSIAR